MIRLELKPGDDITIAGKFVRAENGCLLILTQSGTEIWIEPQDVYTSRPNGKERRKNG